MDMAHLMAEIDAPQRFQLMDEAFGVTFGNISGSHDAVDQNAQLEIIEFPLPEEIALVVFVIGADTVSYTHLDVYKRQNSLCT